jgi:hypothetical protein
MTTMTTQTELDDVINQLADVVKPVVEAIEKNKHPTTMHNYDQYMSAITKIAGMLSASERNSSAFLGIGVAMQRAGANKQGVQAALRAMGHL